MFPTMKAAFPTAADALHEERDPLPEAVTIGRESL